MCSYCNITVNREEVVVLTFHYIELLKRTGPLEWIWQEAKQMSDIEFMFLSKKKPINFVTEVSSNMQWYPPEGAFVALPHPLLAIASKYMHTCVYCRCYLWSIDQ